MSEQPRVPLCRLWMKRSGAGREYLVGRMGGARVLIFRNDRKATPEDPDFEMFAVPADDGFSGRATPETRATQLAGSELTDDDFSPVIAFPKRPRDGAA